MARWTPPSARSAVAARAPARPGRADRPRASRRRSSSGPRAARPGRRSFRQMPASSRSATGPSSASWSAPSGSMLVVKSHFGVARAAPEDDARASRPARRRGGPPALRARDLERQRRRRRRAGAVDVVAVGVAGAAGEGPEAAALRDERALAALGAGLADPFDAPASRAPRPAAVASPCAPGTASRPGTGRCGRAG